MRKNMFALSLVILTITVFSFNSAQASSFGSGTLNVSLTLTYDSTEMEWYNAYSSLETWNIGQIFSPYPSIAVADYKDIYDTSTGWTPVPDPISVSYGDSTVDITSSIDSSDGLKPSGRSDVQVTGFASGDSSQHNYSYSNMIYIAGLHALADGSFTFTVDYSGTWTGTTSVIGDEMFLAGDVQVSIFLLDWDSETGQFIYTTVDSGDIYSPLSLKDGEDGGISDFNGQLQYSINFNKDDYFYIRNDNVNWAWAHSAQEIAPVPEPATLLLLGSGLVGLVGLRRRLKKS